MELRRTLSSLWRYLFQRRQMDSELREELDLFLADLMEKNIRSGMNATTARRAALMEVGGVTQVETEVRNAWTQYNTSRELLESVEHGLLEQAIHVFGHPPHEGDRIADAACQSGALGPTADAGRRAAFFLRRDRPFLIRLRS